MKRIYDGPRNNNFWDCIIQKYEEHNNRMENEFHNLMSRVYRLEASLPLLIGYGMKQFYQSNPNADLTELLPEQGKNICQEQQTESDEIPNLKCSYSFDDIDVNKITEMRTLCTYENRLLREVKKLKEKEDAMKSARNDLTNICNANHSRESNKYLINDTVEDMQALNTSLMLENRKLKDDLHDIQMEIQMLKRQMKGPLSRELQRERLRSFELSTGSLNSNCINNDQENVQNYLLFCTQLKQTENKYNDILSINEELEDQCNYLSNFPDFYK